MRNLYFVLATSLLPHFAFTQDQGIIPTHSNQLARTNNVRPHLADLSRASGGGNGGVGYYDTINDQLYLYDFWLGRIHNGPWIPSSSQVEPESLKEMKEQLYLVASETGADLDLLTQKMAELLAIDPVTVYAMIFAFNQFEWEVLPAALIRTRDYKFPIELNPNEITQIATRFGRSIYISQEAWMKMDAANQIGLLFHEVIYALLHPVLAPQSSSVATERTHVQFTQSVIDIVKYLFKRSMPSKGKQKLHQILGAGHSKNNYYWPGGIPRQLGNIGEQLAGQWSHTFEDRSHVIESHKIFGNFHHDNSRSLMDAKETKIRVQGSQIDFNPAFAITIDLKTTRYTPVVAETETRIDFAYLNRDDVHAKIDKICTGYYRKPIGALEYYETYHLEAKAKSHVLTVGHQEGDPLPVYVSHKLSFSTRSLMPSAPFQNFAQCAEKLKSAYQSAFQGW